MRRITRSAIVALALCTLIAGASGCKKEGPGERAGREIDQAAEKAGNQVERAGDKLNHALKDLKK